MAKRSIGPNTTILFACSGGSNVGELTDRAARTLQGRGSVVMSCPPAVSARIPDYLAKLKKDRRVVALDGCPHDCVARTLGNCGFSGFVHIRLDELGMKMDSTRVTDAAVKTICDHVAKTVKAPATWKANSFSYRPAKDLLKGK
jgi:uncharacterized metal-binding protein